MNLFDPVVDADRFHPAFANIKKLDNRFEREVLNDWANGFVDRDGKFVTEFQTTFDSSFWELYLHAVLKELGATIDFTHSRPDFCVTDPVDFCVEAAVALHAHDATAATAAYLPEQPVDLEEFNRQAVLRLANTVSSKSRKCLEEYCLLDHVRDSPFVIAIAPFDRPGFSLQVQRAIEAYLFGYYVDESRGSIDDLLKDGPPVSMIDHVVKDSGAEVPVGVFTDPEYAHISAVVFSTCATWSKVSAVSGEPDAAVVFETIHYNPESREPRYAGWRKSEYSEHLLDGLRIYHNPFAARPLPIGLFSDERVFQSYYSHEAEEWCYQASHKNLLFRRSIRFVPKGGAQD